MTSETLTKYAMILGTISSILMIIQWSPQIYTTWKIKVNHTNFFFPELNGKNYIISPKEH